MIKLFYYVVFIFLIIIFSKTVYAGPFGTYMGENISNFKNLDEERISGENRKSYLTRWMPKKNSTFDAYGLFFYKDGLAKIMAFGNEHKYDKYGNIVKSEYNQLKDSLIKKYGEPKLSNDDDSNDDNFPLKVFNNQKLFVCLWQDNLPDDLMTSALIIKATKNHETYVELTYEYKNWNNVIKEKEKENKDSL